MFRSSLSQSWCLWDSAITQWPKGHNDPHPSDPNSHRQKSWDVPRVSSIVAELLATVPDSLSKARLLSASNKESCAWLRTLPVHTLPVTSLGLRTIGLTLHPSPLPPLWIKCGHTWQAWAQLSFQCRHFRHAMLNDILHRALSSTNVPSQLEPTGLDRADGKRSDGITMLPWSYGRFLVRDATCVDTFAPYHLSSSASEVCAAANQAEQTKIKKYSYLTSHVFKTTGVCGLHSIVIPIRLGSLHCDHRW